MHKQPTLSIHTTAHIPLTPSTSPNTQDIPESSVTGSASASVKHCEACHVTQTPQWRRGPGGSRTLCNACGVKYSQGRPLIIKSNSALAKRESHDAVETVYYKNVHEPNVIHRQSSSPDGMPVGEAEIMIHKPIDIAPGRRKRKHGVDHLNQRDLLQLDLYNSDEEMDTDLEKLLVDNFLNAVRLHTYRKGAQPSWL